MLRAANLFEIHDGKVTRLVNYWDLDIALAELDLSAKRGNGH
jgi:hypothetical protein